MSIRRQSRWTVPLVTLFLPKIILGAPVNGLPPQDVVRLFTEVYGTKRMAEILPYTLPGFTDGLPPRMWLERTYSALKALGYVHLDSVIEKTTMKGGEVTIVVSTRIRTKVTTGSQSEIYRLVLTGEGWKLLDLEIVPGPRPPDRVPSGYL